uniref:Transcriptional regulator n=1 Tax=Heterorhabditis bacteriophora TaxID=37862 RepID=A0A1I7XBT5_HETBA
MSSTLTNLTGQGVRYIAIGKSVYWEKTDISIWLIAASDHLFKSISRSGMKAIRYRDCDLTTSNMYSPSALISQLEAELVDSNMLMAASAKY